MTAFRILAIAGCLAGLLALRGQAPLSPAFDVVSVKRNTSIHNGIGNQFGPATARWTNVPLKALIEDVYRLKSYQILGAPAWLDSDRWDIDAKAAGPATSQQKNAMMATLLADRFHLQFHRETRQLPVYRLTVGKSGSKLASAKPQDADHRWGTTPGPGYLMMRGAQIQEFAYWLSVQLNLPIVENTGLTGRYDLKLEWAQDDTPAAETPSDPARMSIFSAVEEQLGLKLQAAKGPVEVLVIDHVEKPAGN